MTTIATAQLRTHSRARVAAVGIGNFMEWFDFAIYGFFAVLLGQLSRRPGTSSR
jgi:MHS family proline/betaine transporter-like MFS transporter